MRPSHPVPAPQSEMKSEARERFHCARAPTTARARAGAENDIKNDVGQMMLRACENQGRKVAGVSLADFSHSIQRRSRTRTLPRHLPDHDPLLASNAPVVETTFYYQTDGKS